MIPRGLVSPLAVAVALAAASLAGAAEVPVQASPVESRVAVVGDGVSSLTGVAVSPLLVLSVLGFVHWVKAAPDAALPLHATPWFWGITATVAAISLLASLCSKAALPGPVAKAVDAARYLEQKAVTLIAAGAFIPTIVRTMQAAGLDPASPDPSEAAQAGVVGGLALGIVALVVFGVVRIVSLTIDALVVLSPFALVDFVLYAARLALVMVILGAMAIHPLLGLLVSSVLILVCLLVAGWCVRLNVFASSCAWDLLTFRWRRVRADDGPVRAFAASGRHGPAVRTRGFVEPHEQGIRFRWRPWFVLPERSIVMPADRRVLIRGVVWSSVALEDGRTRIDLVLLPPRYQPHHEAVGSRLGARPVDGLIRRGIKETIEFVRGIFRMTNGAAAPGAATPASMEQ